MISFVVSLLGEVSTGLAADEAAWPMCLMDCAGLPRRLRGDMKLFFSEKVKPKERCDTLFT